LHKHERRTVAKNVMHRHVHVYRKQYKMIGDLKK